MSPLAGLLSMVTRVIFGASSREGPARRHRRPRAVPRRHPSASAPRRHAPIVHKPRVRISTGARSSAPVAENVPSNAADFDGRAVAAPVDGVRRPLRVPGAAVFHLDVGDVVEDRPQRRRSGPGRPAGSRRSASPGRCGVIVSDRGRAGQRLSSSRIVTATLFAVPTV